MISLDSQTLKLAEQKKNFSQWVRAQLIKVDENENKVLRRFRYTCNECDYHFDYSSKTPDEFFYCPRMFKDKCENKAVLPWVEV